MRVWLCLACLILLYSCSNNQNEWLIKYARYKCDYNNLLEERAQTENTILARLSQRKDSIQNQLNTLFAAEIEKIKTLNAKLILIEKNYTKEYMRLQDIQSAKYGHKSTPAYEKQNEILNNKRIKDRSKIDLQIEVQKKILGEKEIYINGEKELKKIESEILNTKENVKEQFQQKLISAKDNISNHNQLSKNITGSLNKEELKLFNSEKDSIKNDPCGYGIN